MSVLDGEAVAAWLSQDSSTPSLWPDVATALAGWISSGRQQPMASLAQELWHPDSLGRLSLC
jgi:hypothetical protein